MTATILHAFDEPRFVYAEPNQENRYCPKCRGVQLFVALREEEFGLVGTCTGCGDEYLRPFSRTTTTEVA